MIPKLVEQITEQDLIGLIGKQEGRQLEFKGDLDFSREAVKEFLKDVSGMANAEGGDVIYGIDEAKDENGNTVATSIGGIAENDADEVIGSLTQILRDNIQPRLASYRIRDIRLENGNTVFVVRTPKSWNSPHAVDYRGHWRFYYRHSNSTQPMDVTELRNAFLYSDTLAQSLESFRKSRLIKVSSNSTFDNRAKTAILFQPLVSAQPGFSIDMNSTRFDPRKLVLIDNHYGDWYDTGTSSRVNFDGLFAAIRAYPEVGYIQVFRNGTVEVVDTTLLTRQDDPQDIPIRLFEYEVILATVRILALLKDMRVDSPVLVSLSLIEVNGRKIKIDFSPHTHNTKPNIFAFEQRDLPLPAILFSDDLMAQFQNVDLEDKERLQSLFELVSTSLLPAFNIVWNSAGLLKSIYYNTNDIWTGKQESTPTYLNFGA